jgi:hypothetical protein
MFNFLKKYFISAEERSRLEQERRKAKKYMLLACAGSSLKAKDGVIHVEEQDDSIRNDDRP